MTEVAVRTQTCTPIFESNTRIGFEDPEAMLNHLLDKNLNLEKRLSYEQEAGQELRRQVTGLHQVISDLVIHSEDLTKQNKSLTEEQFRSHTSFNKLSDKCQRLEDEIKLLSNENKELTKRLLKLEISYKDLQKEKSDLLNQNSQLKKNKRNAANIRSKNQDLKKQLEGLQGSCDGLRQQNSDLTFQTIQLMQDHSMEKEALQNMNVALQAQILQMSMQYSMQLQRFWATQKNFAQSRQSSQQSKK